LGTAVVGLEVAAATVLGDLILFLS
jgi:hypothetical protein